MLQAAVTSESKIMVNRSNDENFALVIDALRKFRHSVETRLEKVEMSFTSLGQAITQLQADEATEQSQIAANTAVLTSISGSLQTVIQELAAGGVSQSQLASLQALDAEIQSNVSTLNSTDAAAASVGGGASSVGGGASVAGAAAVPAAPVASAAAVAATKAATPVVGAGSAPTAVAGADPHKGAAAPMPETHGTGTTAKK